MSKSKRKNKRFKPEESEEHHKKEEGSQPVMDGPSVGSWVRLGFSLCNLIISESVAIQDRNWS